MTPGSFFLSRYQCPTFPCTSWRGAGQQSAGPTPQDTWISVTTWCQGWSHLRMLVPLELGTRNSRWQKPQTVSMDCTAVSPEDTRGREAPTEKLRLDLWRDFCLLFMHTLGRSVFLNSADTLGCPSHPLQGAQLSFRRNLEFYPLLCKINVPNQMDFLKAQVPFLWHTVRGSTPALCRGTLRQISRRLLTCHRLLFQHCNWGAWIAGFFPLYLCKEHCTPIKGFKIQNVQENTISSAVNITENKFLNWTSTIL